MVRNVSTFPKLSFLFNINCWWLILFRFFWKIKDKSRGLRIFSKTKAQIKKNTQAKCFFLIHVYAHKISAKIIHEPFFLKMADLLHFRPHPFPPLLSSPIQLTSHSNPPYPSTPSIPPPLPFLRWLNPRLWRWVKTRSLVEPLLFLHHIRW